MKNILTAGIPSGIRKSSLRISPVKAAYRERYLSFPGKQFLKIKAQGFICAVVSDKTIKMLSF